MQRIDHQDQRLRNKGRRGPRRYVGAKIDEMDIDSTSSNRNGSDVIVPTKRPTRRVRQVLQNIYRDLDRLPRMSQGEALSRLKKAKHAIRTATLGYNLRKMGPYYRKLGTLAKNLGWPLFSYLALAPAFEDAVALLSTKRLEELLIVLGLNAASFTLFAKVRGIYSNNRILAEISMLEKYNSVMPYGDLSDPFPFIVKNSDVHRYIVPSRGKLIKLNKKRRISENIYNPMYWFAASKPVGWPLEFPFPSDPSPRRVGSACFMCGSSFLCSCHPEQYHKEPLLVELRNYGIKGNGIRALQNIAKGTVLGEYVGRFLPLHAQSDLTYALEFVAAVGNEKERGVAVIDAAVEGNWTRFMNHSCNANTNYVLCAIGTKQRVIVEAVRTIRVYEEITSDYSDGYFTGGLICHCGYSHCRFPSQEDSDD